MDCKDCTYVSGESEYWCDKVGGKIPFFGTCGDCEGSNQNLPTSHYHRRKNKGDRRLAHFEKTKNK